MAATGKDFASKSKYSERFASSKMEGEQIFIEKIKKRQVQFNYIKNYPMGIIVKFHSKIIKEMEIQKMVDNQRKQEELRLQNQVKMEKIRQLEKEQQALMMQKKKEVNNPKG